MDVLRANAERHPEKLLYAFLDRDGRTTHSYTYEAFVQRTAEIAAHIAHSHPLEQGDRVLLVYPPGLEVIAAFFACVRLGLIPVPVYPPSSHGFSAALYKMNFIAEDCRAAAVLTDRAYSWSLRLHRARTRLASLTVRRDYTSRLPWIVTSDAHEGEWTDVAASASDVLFLQYTSGSTNEPKGVMVTHANVLSNCDAVVDHVPVTVSWLPQYHDMGLIAFYLFMAMAGGTTYGCSPIDFIHRPLVWLEAMTAHQATASAAPNFAYAYCLRPDKVPDESLERLDLRAMRVLLNGAEPVKADVFQAFLHRFAPCGLSPSGFSTAYGLAENTLAVTGRGRRVELVPSERLRWSSSSGERPLRTEGEQPLVSSGKPLGDNQVRIVDTDLLRPVPEGHVGEIWVTGSSKCLGYWGRPELTTEVFEARIEGDDDPQRTWLRTGDLGFMSDGELFVCGRAKDVIIVRGANYYPQDIEAVVEEDRAVRRGCVAAFGAPDEGYEVVVVAELRHAKRAADTRRINRLVRERLGIPVDLFVFIPKRTIPKTSSGKISRYLARHEWLEGRLRVLDRVGTGGADPRDEHVEPSWDAAGQASTEAELGALFRKYGLTGHEVLTAAEAGLDSLAIVDLTLDIERYLEGRGASELAEGVEVRWLQAIPVAELFALLEQIGDAAPGAKLRFRRAFAALRADHLEAESDLMRRDAQLGVDVRRAPAGHPAASLDPGSILLTGGTGFFGPFLLKSILEQTDGPVQVLVRAHSEEQAYQRLEASLATVGNGDEASALEGWRERVTPVCGDLSLPRFGLSTDQWSALGRDVGTVYNNGALVNYLLDYAGMRSTNVASTNEVLRLVSSGRPKVLNHISTTFIFGWSTKETLFETDANQDMELLDFGYSQSKWVSEQLVLQAISRGLPARVFRPALISPSVEGGGHNFDIAIRLLAFMLHHGITTVAKNQVSLMPADIGASNIVAISRMPDTVGSTFHVTRDEYASLIDITRIFEKVTGTQFASYEVGDFVTTMIERCTKGDLLFPLVNFLVHSADNITAMEFKRYDSTNYQTARDRSPAGLADPPLEDVVLGILRFMARQGIIAEEKADRVLARS